MALTGLIYNTSKENDREQWRRSLAEAGLTLVDGSFEEGATANNKTDAVWHIAGGQCYTWDSTFPKDVPAKSTPASTGGVADGGVGSTTNPTGLWVPVSDSTLRALLKSTQGGANVNLTYGTVAQALNDYVTPEMFGAVGDGAFLDDVAFSAAASSGKHIICAPGKKYTLTSQIVFPFGHPPQVIDGNGSTITWKGGNKQPFNQVDVSGNLVGYTTSVSYQNLILNGPVKAKSKFSEFASCHAINYADGYARNITFNGWTNGFRAFGNTFADEIYADEIRNAIWSERNNNNHIRNVKGGWIAGDVIVCYSQLSSVADIDVEYAGVIPADTEETGASRIGWGCLVSTGQDGYADQTKDVRISNVKCKWHGGGGIIIGGERVSVGGVIDLGDAYRPSFAARQWAIWLSGTDNTIGDVSIGQTQGVLQLQSGATRCNIGRIFVGKQLVGSAPFLLSAYDDASAGTVISQCRIESIFMNGHLRTGNAIVVSTSGVSIGKVHLRSNGNLDALRAVLLRGGSNVEEFRSYNFSKSAGTADVIELQEKDGLNPVIGKLEIQGHFGVSVHVVNGCVPLLGDIQLRGVGNGGLPPIIIENDGTGYFFFGNININGALGSQPRMNGTLSCSSFYSPVSWVKNDASVLGVTKYPEQVSHTL